MTPGEEFRIYMKAANRDQFNPDDPHLSEATMIAYYRGGLSETEREATQEHLVTCAACIALLRSATDFLEPARPDEEDITEAETNQQWQSVWQRVKSAEPPESPAKTETPVVRANFGPSRVKKVFMNSRPSLPLAASLVISLGVVGLLGWSYWQERQSRLESQKVAAELQNKQRELEQRLAQLSQSDAEQFKRERELRLAAEAERDQLLAAVRPPDYAQDYSFTFSSDRGSTQELQLKLNTAAKVNLLISKPGAFGQYKVEILDEGGNVLRKFHGLRPKGNERALSFRLNRGALSPGKYRLRLSGQQGSVSTQLGESDLVVNVALPQK